MNSLKPYSPRFDARERDGIWRLAVRSEPAVLLSPYQRGRIAEILECPWRQPLRTGGAWCAYHLDLAREQRQARALKFARDNVRYARLAREWWHSHGGGVP